MFTVVLAGTQREASLHAQRHQLPRGQWRYALRAASIRRLRVAEIHILPGFAKRADRHSILAELRYTKGDRLSFDEPMTLLKLEDAIGPAYEEHAVREHARELRAAADATFGPKPVAKRRSRAPKPVSEKALEALEAGAFF